MLLENGVCDLFMNATIESPRPKVYGVFCSSLNSSLAMHDDIYDRMAGRGLYSAEPSKI